MPNNSTIVINATHNRVRVGGRNLPAVTLSVRMALVVEVVVVTDTRQDRMRRA